MLVDLGAVANKDLVARALEQCIVARLVSLATIEHELGRLAAPGREGVRVLRRVLSDWAVGGTAADSELELVFVRLCRRAGLPRPEFQYELTLGGRSRRLDFAYPDHRLAVEVDGFACRTDRAGFQDERWRQNDLIRAGWWVLRFTWHDITHRPDYVAASVRSLLTRRCVSFSRDRA